MTVKLYNDNEFEYTKVMGHYKSLIRIEGVGGRRGKHPPSDIIYSRGRSYLTTLSVTQTSERRMNWKGFGRKRPRSNYPRIFLE